MVCCKFPFHYVLVFLNFAPCKLTEPLHKCQITSMLDKLDAIKARFDELAIALTNPEIVSDNKRYSAMSKEYRSLEKIVIKRNEYVKVLDDIGFNK